MTDTLTKVYLTRFMLPPVLERLEALCEMHVNPNDRTLTRDELLSAVSDTDILVPNGPDKIDEEVFEAATQLKLIANFGVGYNNIDVDAATRRGIPVTNTPGVLSEATADIAWALLMSVARRTNEGERLIRDNGWTGWSPFLLLGGDVTGATLGLMGLGRIGKAMIPRAKGFSMKVIYWNRTRLDPAEEVSLGIEYVSKETLLATADFVSLHVALVPETHHLISTAELKQMKPTSYLINTTRGPVVDERALVSALESGVIAGAGLDVFENEPCVEPGLLKLDNVTMAPHLGSATVGTRVKMGMLVVDNCEAFINGIPLPNLVNG